MRNGERRKMDVRHLPGSRQPPTVHDGIVEQAYVVGDEPVMRRRHGGPETRHGFPDAQGVGISGLGEDANAPVLRQRTETYPDSMRSASQSDAAA